MARSSGTPIRTSRIEFPLKHWPPLRISFRSRPDSGQSGWNSVRFRWMPKEQLGNKCNLEAAAFTAGPFASIVAEVIVPRPIAWKMVSLTESLMPRSSAFTIILNGMERSGAAAHSKCRFQILAGSPRGKTLRPLAIYSDTLLGETFPPWTQSALWDST